MVGVAVPAQQPDSHITFSCIVSRRYNWVNRGFLKNRLIIHHMTQIDNKAGTEGIPTERKGGMPVKLKQDYSELPQKPIKLKEGIGGLAKPLVKPIEKTDSQAPARPAANTPQKRTAKKPRQAVTQWTLRGVSPVAREAAVSAAREAGMPLGAWLEKTISQAVIPAAKAEYSQQPMLEALADIQARLARLEHRLDWPSRLKEYLKTWLG
jgi:hypothetical protein